MNVSLRQYHDLLASYLWPQRGRVALLAVFILGNTGLAAGHAAEKFSAALLTPRRPARGLLRW